MANNHWETQYEQLNQRSRSYAAQLWYVPFAYIGLVGLGLEKILNWCQPLKSFGLILMGIFSIAVFVHVSSIKYLERRAVKSMRELEENGPISTGGSRWYLSFAWYIRLILILLTYSFIAYGISLLTIAPFSPFFLIPMIALTILYGILIYKNHSKNKPLVNEIRDGN